EPLLAVDEETTILLAREGPHLPNIRGGVLGIGPIDFADRDPSMLLFRRRIWHPGVPAEVVADLHEPVRVVAAEGLVALALGITGAPGLREFGFAQVVEGVDVDHQPQVVAFEDVLPQGREVEPPPAPADEDLTESMAGEAFPRDCSHTCFALHPEV